MSSALTSDMRETGTTILTMCEKLRAAEWNAMELRTTARSKLAVESVGSFLEVIL